MFKKLNRHHTRSAKWESVRHTMNQNDYLVFSVADSDYPTCEVIIETLKKRIDHGAFGYTLIDDEYNQAIVKWWERRYDVSIKPSWIVPSSKVLALLSAAIEVYTQKHEKVLIQTPVYHVFFPLINHLDRTLIVNPLHYIDNYYSIDFSHLESQFKLGVKAMVLCNPHNPVGRVWRYQELKKLVHLCKTYDVVLISDEIHADIIMKSHKFTSVGHFFDIYQRLIIVHAPSKTFNVAGLHSAYAVIVDKTLRDTLKTTLMKRFMYGSNTLAIETLISAYSQCDDWVDAQNQHVYTNYLKLKDFLAETMDGVHLLPLEGSYLAWLDMTKLGLSSKSLSRMLKSEGIVLSEGLAFGEQCDGFMRMNLAVADEQLEEGLMRLKRALKKKIP